MTSQSVPRRWQQAWPALWYPALGLLLLGASFVPALHRQGTLLGSVPDRPFDALAVIANKEELEVGKLLIESNGGVQEKVCPLAHLQPPDA